MRALPSPPVNTALETSPDQLGLPRPAQLDQLGLPQLAAQSHCWMLKATTIPHHRPDEQLRSPPYLSTAAPLPRSYLYSR